jgi:ABC-type transport system involved in multi-copper enzyme maturation permease subunit
MPIHDQGYRHWEGTLKSHTFRWWVIAREGLRIILRRKLFLLFIMAPAMIHFLGRGVYIYLVNMVMTVRGLPQVNAKFFYDFLSMQTFFIVLICVFGGAGLIANDLKNNVMQMYFSKPLKRADYLVGKLVTIMTLLTFVTFILSFLLFLENLLLGETVEFLRKNYWILGSIFLYSLVLTLPTGLLILALSSLTKNNRYAAICFAAIVLFTPVVFEILKNIFRTSKIAPISFWANLLLLGNKLFGLSPGYSSHWGWSMLIFLGIIASCIWTLNRKIKGVEVIK